MRVNPYTIKKLDSGKYRVLSGKKIFANATTKKKAQAQARLLAVKAQLWSTGLKSRLKADRHKQKNPPYRVPVGSREIYGRLLRIEAQKSPDHACDAKCQKANHCYYHNFTKHARVWGLPNGALYIIDGT